MNKRGSALLIVLGFLSFMVVSAVAFSIYMRSERIPSSVFRKNAAVRQLVRAGLGHAISELDNVIRDDPFPGVIRNPGQNRKYMQRASRDIPVNPPYAGLDGNRRYIDWWIGRLFMPPNPDDDEDGSLLAPQAETISVVTLEGLGYVPPPLINDVRFLSRRTWTAKWRDFDYGVGRYAYCAVNVSDYFDINRMPIDVPRNGIQRVSLASLFTKNDTTTDIDESKVSAFSRFVASPGGGDGAQSTWPLVSMLDYALANKQGINGFESYPFYRWIYNTTSRRGMYPGQDTDDAQHQIFVTDSWFPPSYKDSQGPSLDLDATGNERGQIFDLSSNNEMTMTTRSLFDFIERNTPQSKLPDAQSEDGLRVEDMFSLTERVALYDYLDRDDVPTSLALPTMERNPMVVAISPMVNSFKPTVPAQALDQADSTTKEKHTTVFFDNMSFNDVAMSGFNVVLAYPFKYNDLNGVNLAQASYQVQAVAKIFFVSKAKGLGTRGKAFQGTSYNNAVFRPKNDADYTGNSSYADNVVTLVAQPQNVSFNGANDIAKDVPIMFKPLSDKIPVAEHISKWVDEVVQNGVVTQSGHAESTWNLQFFPLDADGNIVNPNGYSAGAATLPTDPDGFMPVMVVWIRVKDVNRNFVADFVPATFYEDRFNNVPENSDLGQDVGRDACGSREPLLRFSCDASTVPVFQFSGLVAGASTGPFTTTVDYTPGNQDWLQKGIYAVDPRYNHAPEDWCMDTGAINAQDWIRRAEAASGANDADGDPYAFVSNQGFMQSMGELAFLPKVKDWFCKNNEMSSFPWGARWRNKRANDYINGLSEYATSVSGGLADMVYHTYEPWENSTGEDNLFGCGIAEPPSSGYVNPYSDNVNALMAALANTPVNWWAAAGTNTVRDASRGQNAGDTVSTRDSNFKTLQKGLEFAFNEKGSAASEDRELKYEALKKLANGMSNAFRAGVKDGRNWEQVYDSWDWTPDGTPFSWTDDSNFRNQLDAIDCRYLHSFWRGCFANRQQLFLIFVRAESTALGGSGEGQIPPQQGGRAVALVWRDPETPNGGNDSAQIDSTSYRPHRTRVLFYHQFD